MSRSDAALLLIISISSAQAVRADEDALLQEVIVTGERQARSLSETASSVSVVDRQTLENSAGNDRAEQFLTGIPNVQLGSGGEGPSIRGQDTTGVLRDLPAFIGGARPRTTLQVDGRAVSFNEYVFGAAPVWDVERIEVFRSPQTSTQGRNSIAGALFIHSNDPTYQWEGAARLISGDQHTRQGSLVLSGPLVDDQLAFRIAGDLRSSHTASRIADVIDGANPDRDRYGLVRLKVLAEPAAYPASRISGTWVHSESRMPQIESVRVPFRSRTDSAPLYGVFYTNVDSMTLVLDQDLGSQVDWKTTASTGSAFIERFAPPGLGQARTHARDYSFESTLVATPGEVLQVFGGVSSSRTSLRQDINLSSVLGIGRFRDTQDSLGVFGELRWGPWRGLTVSPGLRYQRDHQDRQGAITSVQTSYPVSFDKSFDAWLPRLALSWEPVKGYIVGAMVQRAFNAGGVNFNFDSGAQSEFGAETQRNFELFTRMSLAAGRAFLSANFFRSDGRDSQRARTRAYTVPGGATAFWAEIQNAPSTRSQGVEAELDWRLHPRLLLRASLGLLDTRVVDIVGGARQVREFQRAPSISASAAVDWSVTGRLRLAVSGRHHGGYYSNDLNTASLRVSPATVVDARLSYVQQRWTLFGYARNLFDSFYMTSLLSSSQGTAGDPRELGAGLEIRLR